MKGKKQEEAEIKEDKDNHEQGKAGQELGGNGIGWAIEQADDKLGKGVVNE